ncbi:hypothetical protein [Hymenobacter telluris]|uniref:hypothetical protein n=1 Tax=Hymenobacter telluris TaxID=2816474 RepID=UPI001A904F43|nr:hypothetical protein [Hymenobacter telluris]
MQKIAVWADGRTEPIIASGTAIILVQNRKTEVGRLILEDDDYGSFSIEHPVNSEELNTAALNVINQEPELLDSQSSVIVLCPQDIASKMFWPA